MVYRHTPLDSAMRSYSAGGSRTMIDTIDDAKQMQEPNKAQGMRGETFSAMEAPQNYGFTSVVADADKGSNGMIKDCAESFVSFMGGNRSFPVMGLMDDRRHRLLNLAKDAAKGASAMFGLKKWGQQFLNTDDGMYMTGNTQKKMRFALVDNKNDKQQPQQQQSGGGSGGSGGSGAARAARPTHFVSNGVEFAYVIPDFVEVSPLAADGSGGGGNGGSQQQTEQQQQQSRGQKTLHKEDSKTFIDVTTKSIHQNQDSSNHEVKPGSTVGYYKDIEQSYKADQSHAHIKGQGAHVWAEGVPKKSAPFIIQPDPCKL